MKNEFKGTDETANYTKYANGEGLSEKAFFTRRGTESLRLHSRSSFLLSRGSRGSRLISSAVSLLNQQTKP